MQTNNIFMQRALELAARAAEEDEVPIGAVIVLNNKIVGEGFNTKEQQKLSTRHAEINAIEAACQTLGAWRLIDCELYVTLEPCLMCAGALLQSRIKAVYFSVADPKGGALGTVISAQNLPRLNHSFHVESGLGAEKSKKILQDFFKKKRLKKAE